MCVCLLCQTLCSYLMLLQWCVWVEWVGSKPVATVLLMLCSAMFVECLVLKPCCAVMFGMFCVMYRRITFSGVFAITYRRDIGLYDVPMLMSLLGLGIGMMLASFHT